MDRIQMIIDEVELLASKVEEFKFYKENYSKLKEENDINEKRLESISRILYELFKEDINNEASNNSYIDRDVNYLEIIKNIHNKESLNKKLELELNNKDKIKGVKI